MVSSVPAPAIATNEWSPASWEAYVRLADSPSYESARCYYEAGEMRIEMVALGPSHARDNAILSKVVSLFATLRMIRVAEFVNCTFRQEGLRDAQPDLAFYLGDGFEFPPRDNQPVDVNVYGAPQLVVEIASTSLSDDLGQKRLLYERLGVKEYWVVDVERGRLILFAVADGRSGEVRESGVLSGLGADLVEEALERGRTEDDGAINRWLIAQFSD